MLSFLWLSPATFSIPDALKYIQLKPDLQESQKVNKNDNSRHCFVKNAFISCFAGARGQILWWCALIVLVFGERGERIVLEGAQLSIHFELALLSLGYHVLLMQSDINILNITSPLP